MNRMTEHPEREPQRPRANDVPKPRHFLRRMIDAILNRVRRQPAGKPEPDVPGIAEENQLRLRKNNDGNMELLVIRHANGIPVGQYSIPIPHPVKNKGLHTSYGLLSMFQEKGAQTHAAIMLEQVGTVFAATASRIRRNIQWTEEPEHPLSPEILRRLKFRRREEIKAGGDYHRQFIHSAPHPELTAHQESIVKAIVENIRSK